MANKRSISIANTGNVKISIILNYREVGCSTFDLLSGGRIDASLRELTCIVINDVENLAVFGQDAVRLTPDS